MADDLLNKEVILRILSEVEKSEDKDRRRQSFNSYQVYSGNQKVYVNKELQRTRPKSFESYTVSNISVSKMVTDKRAQAYDEKPVRTVGGNDDKTEALADIYLQAGGNKELQFMDMVYNLNRYSLFWVNYRQQDAQYQFMNLQPYEFVLVRDKNTGKVLIVGLNYPDVDITSDARGGKEGAGQSAGGGDGVADLIAESQADSATSGRTWVFWSANQHVKVRTNQVSVMISGRESLKPSIDYIEIPDNPNNINPLGVLPFILVTSDTSVDYPTVNPLTEQSILFNAQQSETLTAKNVHGSGIQVFKYPEKFAGRFKKMSHGQMQAIELPQSSDAEDKPTEFEYKTSGAQLGPMMASDLNYLQQIFHEHGLENISMEPGGIDIQSGISKAIGGASVQKIIEKNQQLYAQLEKDIFEIIKAYDVLLGTRLFLKEDELTIVYPKPKVMVSDKQTLDNIKLMLELEVIEEWEKFIKMDPNLSEQQAKDKLERIDARKKERAKEFLSGNIQNRVSEEGEA